MLNDILSSNLLISASVFAAAVMMFGFAYFLLSPIIQTRQRMSERLLAEGVTNRRSLQAQTERIRIAAQRPVEAFFSSVEREQKEPGALEGKLFRAGFHQKSAPLIYTMSRVAFVAIGFFVSFAGLSTLLPPAIPSFFAFIGAAMFGLCCLVIPSIMLDRFENTQKQHYRRGFPDFMDMMITCADAGMSLEAAVERVSRCATHCTIFQTESVLRKRGRWLFFSDNRKNLARVSLTPCGSIQMKCARNAFFAPKKRPMYCQLK